MSFNYKSIVVWFWPDKTGIDLSESFLSEFLLKRNEDGA